MLKIDNVTNEINDWINEKDYAIIPRNVLCLEDYLKQPGLYHPTYNFIWYNSWS